MFEIGRNNSLKIKKIDANGAWLASESGPVLLPARECSPNLRLEDLIDVFVYRDSAEALTATLRKPKAQVGEFALLQVKQVGKYGAFLDWGLSKDLLVPYAEQNEKMQEGRSYLVKVCRDSQGRVVGTAKIDRCLVADEIELKEGEEVDLIIWKFTELGAKVIVNNLYEAVLYRDQVGSGLKRGDRLKGYISRIREDKKIDVSLRKSGAEGAASAKTVIMTALAETSFLPLHDQSPPADIQQRLGLSKKVFKKAIGGLYKDGLIELQTDGIRLR
ncbi:MAG TPA: S1-like domain-containing RNA-binding protein [Geopsychrobacteraceae bacterium]|nr:S1-like domain-containing RNA-binding protein [Geopsychrobacteraceae bacterium]